MLLEVAKPRNSIGQVDKALRHLDESGPGPWPSPLEPEKGERGWTWMEVLAM